MTVIQEVKYKNSGSITSQGMTMLYSGGTKHARGLLHSER